MSDGNLKVPSQVFRWFEKMKTNYENSVQSVLSRFEDYNLAQQQRLDNANNNHIKDLKSAHQEQLAQSQQQITQLKNDINYYKQQIAQQQQTIEQLNTRYDAVMSCLLTEQKHKVDIKDIFDNDDFFSTDEPTLPTISNSDSTSDYSSDNLSSDNIRSDNMSSQTQLKNEDLAQQRDLSEEQEFELLPSEQLFEQAIKHRESGEFAQAFKLFEQAAKKQHVKAMGAMGRSYFLGEGVDEDHQQGLVWLIKAAENEHPQAIARVAHFQENEPELFEKAQELAATC